MTEKQYKQAKKEAKAQERMATLRRGLVLVTNDSEKAVKYGYTKLVTADKAYELIHGKITNYTETQPGVWIPVRKKTSKHNWEVA